MNIKNPCRPVVIENKYNKTLLLKNKAAKPSHHVIPNVNTIKAKLPNLSELFLNQFCFKYVILLSWEINLYTIHTNKHPFANETHADGKIKENISTFPLG